MTSHLYVIKLEVQCAYLGKFELVWFLFLYSARDDWLSEIQYIYVLLDLTHDWSVSNRNWQIDLQLRIQAKYEIFMRAGKLQITR